MTFDTVLDNVTSLPPEQQETLIDIIRMRLIESKRDSIEKHFIKSKEDFKDGKLVSETASELIERLHKSLEENVL